MKNTPEHPKSGNPAVPPGTTGDAGPPPHDDLDALLRSWHDTNAERAADGRDALLERLKTERVRRRQKVRGPSLKEQLAERLDTFIALARSLIVNRYTPALASLTLIVIIVAVFVPGPQRGTAIAQAVMVPDGGRLDARDPDGAVIGPCALQHTDVDVDVSGMFSRVTVRQRYANPYDKKIEAVYTFPLSHRSAVDRMTMTVGDRVVVGEVKEREKARAIYEAARDQGYVASLLEQERPNIFTQSVANIEPKAEVIVEISYVELLERDDDRFSFHFPMVVGPRYIPGATTSSPTVVPAELTARQGVVLLGPAQLSVGAGGDVTTHGPLQGGKLQTLLGAAQAIEYPGEAWWGAGDATGGTKRPSLWHPFEATYCDGATERGELFIDGTGWINGRWFFTDPTAIASMGTGFSGNTNQVPDASRITPMPVRPDERAGHDISVSMTIDTGGPGVIGLKSELHDIKSKFGEKRDDGNPRVVTLELAGGDAIPNKDFAVSWGQTADTIEEAVFVHSAGVGDQAGGFFTLMLQPPDRIEDAAVPARELVFVLDTSGSMSGHPLNKSKALMDRALDAMRPQDTFNIITFAGHTSVLWEQPLPATAANREAARQFVNSRKGGGGTEMMKAVEAALVQRSGEQAKFLSPEALANLPADGRMVTVQIDGGDLVNWPPPNVRSSWAGYALQPAGGPPFEIALANREIIDATQGLRVTGRWITANQRRILQADHWSYVGDDFGPEAMRLVVFLTDGYIGNDMAIIDAIGRNAKTTRVFSFGIGNNVNRYLLENMADAGRGESEIVLLNADPDAAVQRFSKRIQTPVLMNIELEFSEGLDVADVLPSPDAIPDLWDVEPLIIHGRYTGSGDGTVTVRGRTGAGPWERTIDLELPADAPDHDVIATLWARTKVDAVMQPHLQAIQNQHAPPAIKNEIVALGEQFSIMTQFTSFVAVEKSRLTIGGDPVLVAVPIEFPDGVSWEGIFGPSRGDSFGDHDEDAVTLGEEMQMYFAWQQGRSNEANSVINGLAITRDMDIKLITEGEQQRLRSLGYQRSQLAATPPPTDPGRRSKSGPLEQRRAGEKKAPPGAGGGFGGGGSAGGAYRRSAPGKPAADAPAPASTPVPTTASEEQPEIRRRDTGLQGIDIGSVRKESAANEPEPDVVAGAKVESPDEARAADELGAVTDRELERAGESLERSETAQRDAVLDDLAEADVQDNRKRDELEAEAKAVRERLNRLARVLEQPLLLMVYSAEIDEVHAGADKAAPDGRLDRDGRLLVTVLVTKVDAATKKALEKAGLKIEASSKSLPIIVGRVAPKDLKTIALVEGVRRIERTRLTRE